uniref:BPTI/Kunitz inhibitor domain-containing protein n=1 Tax=Naja naja TaxID=35670 RepID=A0A8C6XCD3_NAJNA
GDIVKPLSPGKSSIVDFIWPLRYMVALDLLSLAYMCNQPLDVGPCKENFTRFYYDRTTKICKPFKFGGCNGNRNNFLNREDCMQECKPNKRQSKGKCTCSFHTRCEPDSQGRNSCHINRKRKFRDANCDPEDKLSYFVLSLSYVSPEICTLPPKVGKCKASFLRFYFNAATGNCEGFIYGGCGGNKNNFVTLGQCRATCQRSGKEEILIFASAHY